MARYFFDTWGWIALGYRRDAHHAQLKRLYDQLSSANDVCFTSDFVLSETIALLFRRSPAATAQAFMQGLFATVDAGRIIVERINDERFASAWQLRTRLADKPRISFTDLTSAVLIDELKLEFVVSADAHFDQIGLNCQRVGFD